MQLSGFLSPSGNFTDSPYWCHTYTAEKICEKDFNKEFNSGIESENFLYDNGYVGFYTSGANFRFVVNGKIILLSNKQIDFLLLNLNNANNQEQKRDIEKILKYNEKYKEHFILQHYD